ncbi:MAG: hypothetical protein PHD03_00160 [Bacilli bacterium]|nr:hypothetical protein [Bacilli bacterium]MDD4406425.1 hypothetical protein [Bacilli bacterium]
MADKNKKEPKANPILGRTGQSIDLVKFNIKNEQDQFTEIEKILKEIYQDNLKISRKYILKCLKLTWTVNDNYIFLPYNLKVSREKFTLKFDVQPKKGISFGWIIFAIWLFIFSIIGATYAGFAYLSIANLNKDIDGDGIADINIDINNDKLAEINIDINNDDIPDLNIDYKGNRRAVFNIDTDGDEKANYNLINDATGGKSCSINCDLKGDGWPDINLDLDGDGIIDTDMDTDNDKVPDLNLDVNGDGLCDIMCDTNGDGVCDVKCIKAEEFNKDIKTGTSTQTGSSNIETSTPYLLINYNDGITVNVRGLLPDDQPETFGLPVLKPVKEFTVENLSDYPIYYGVRWNVYTNTFVTNNLKYTIKGTNGAPNLEPTTMPLTSKSIYERVLIMPRVSQKFKVEINLQGTGVPQNDDQGKVFIGHIEIDLNN